MTLMTPVPLSEDETPGVRKDSACKSFFLNLPGLKSCDSKPHTIDIYSKSSPGLITDYQEMPEKKNAKEAAHGKENTDTVIGRPAKRPVLFMMTAWMYGTLLVIVPLYMVFVAYMMPYVLYSSPDCEKIEMDGSVILKNCAGLKWRGVIEKNGQTSLKFYESYPGQLSGFRPCILPINPPPSAQMQLLLHDMTDTIIDGQHKARVRRFAEESDSPKNRKSRDLIEILRDSYETAKTKYDNLQEQVSSQASKVGDAFNRMARSLTTENLPQQLTSPAPTVHDMEVYNHYRMKRQQENMGNTNEITSESEGIKDDKKEGETDLQEGNSTNLESDIHPTASDSEKEPTSVVSDPDQKTPEQTQEHSLPTDADEKQGDASEVHDTNADVSIVKSDDTSDNLSSFTTPLSAEEPKVIVNPDETTEAGEKTNVAQDDHHDPEPVLVEMPSEPQVYTEVKEKEEDVEALPHEEVNEKTVQTQIEVEVIEKGAAVENQLGGEVKEKDERVDSQVDAEVKQKDVDAKVDAEVKENQAAESQVDAEVKEIDAVEPQVGAQVKELDDVDPQVGADVKENEGAESQVDVEVKEAETVEPQVGTDVKEIDAIEPQVGADVKENEGAESQVDVEVKEVEAVESKVGAEVKENENAEPRVDADVKENEGAESQVDVEVKENEATESQVDPELTEKGEGMVKAGEEDPSAAPVFTGSDDENKPKDETEEIKKPPADLMEEAQHPETGDPISSGEASEHKGDESNK